MTRQKLENLLKKIDDLVEDTPQDLDSLHQTLKQIYRIYLDELIYPEICLQIDRHNLPYDIHNAVRNAVDKYSDCSKVIREKDQISH